ncbi:MAG: ferritin-like domain-containing protein [Candidatus Cryosericum sp.]|nr:ferritin [bacterium]
MASKELLDMLNKAIAGELQVSVQYMWQHVQWKGLRHFSVKDEFEKIAVEEMKHAEMIAERLFYLGGTPTTSPEPITVGQSLKDMLAADIKAEEMTIKLYKDIIALAAKEEDPTTAHIFTEILEDEEEHLDTFQSLAEEG